MINFLFSCIIMVITFFFLIRILYYAFYQHTDPIHAVIPWIYKNDRNKRHQDEIEELG